MVEVLNNCSKCGCITEVSASSGAELRPFEVAEQGVITVRPSPGDKSVMSASWNLCRNLLRAVYDIVTD